MQRKTFFISKQIKSNLTKLSTREMTLTTQPKELKSVDIFFLSRMTAKGQGIKNNINTLSLLFKETKINVYKSLHLFWNAWMQLLKLKSGLWHRYHVVHNTSMSDYPAVPHRSALIISTMIENTYCIYMHMYRTYLTSQRPIIQAWNSTITQKPLFMCICYLIYIPFHFVCFSP